MSKIASVTIFVVLGLGLGYLSLGCACQIAMWVGGRLGDQVRSGSPNMIAVGAFWIAGLIVSSLVNVVFGWWAVTGANGQHPDHAFYAMAVLVMFLIPLVATFLGLAFLAATL